MSEPRRLLSGTSDATALERRLLGAGRRRNEPEGMRDRVRVGVAAAVTAGAISTTAATAKAATASATTKAALTGSASALAKAKIVLLSAALLAAAATGVTVHLATNDASKPPPPATPAIAATATSTATAAPPPVTAPEAIEPEPAVAANDLPSARATKPRAADRAPVNSPPAPSSPSVAHNELREEAALVDGARSALAAGDLVTAEGHLARADVRFPRGRLAEEREALAVRVASASGDGARASRLARVFLERHPTSPLRPSMEAIAKKNAIE